MQCIIVIVGVHWVFVTVDRSRSFSCLRVIFKIFWLCLFLCWWLIPSLCLALGIYLLGVTYLVIATFGIEEYWDVSLSTPASWIKRLRCHSLSPEAVWANSVLNCRLMVFCFVYRCFLSSCEGPTCCRTLLLNYVKWFDSFLILCSERVIVELEVLRWCRIGFAVHWPLCLNTTL